MVMHRQPILWSIQCLSAAVLAASLVGCTLPGQGKSAADPLASLKPVTTASYQEHAIDEGPPKKVKDPTALKLHYAKWMEEIENFPAAETNYNFVLQKQPENVDAILGLARIEQAAGRYAEAEAGFQKALRLHPESAAGKNALGQFYVARERFDEALPFLTAAMRDDPANKRYRFHLAVALAKSGDTVAAFPHFSQTVGESTAHYNIGVILKTQGRYQQAEQHFQQSLAHQPDFEPARQALAEVRPSARAAGGSVAHQQLAPGIQPAGHSRPVSFSPAQQQQLRNQRAIGR